MLQLGAQLGRIAAAQLVTQLEGDLECILATVRLMLATGWLMIEQ